MSRDEWYEAKQECEKKDIVAIMFMHAMVSRVQVNAEQCFIAAYEFADAYVRAKAKYNPLPAYTKDEEGNK